MKQIVVATTFLVCLNLCSFGRTVSSFLNIDESIEVLLEDNSISYGDDYYVKTSVVTSKNDNRKSVNRKPITKGLKRAVYFKTARRNSSVSASDSLALVALFVSTQGVNWNNKTNWLKGDVESWHGVTVERGKVTMVALDRNNLDGQLPAEFGTLADLKKLSLTDNSLSGVIPKEFEGLNSLEQLCLYNNFLTGTIPVELCSLEKLKYLYVHNNSFSDKMSK